ncbi:MAG: hypothetical protein R3C53_21380 [Pirellulaceae bacterium]
MKKRNKGSSQPAHTAVSPRGPMFLLRDYKFLGVVLLLAIPLGIIEASRNDLPRSNGEVPPEWLLDANKNLPQTLVELYPQRSQGYLLRSFQAGMCWDNGYQMEVCEQFPYKDLRDVRAALQVAIDLGGAKDQEELFHFYAFTLAKFGESPEVVDQAVALWRKHFPHSRKPDPRTLVN